MAHKIDGSVFLLRLEQVSGMIIKNFSMQEKCSYRKMCYGLLHKLGTVLSHAFISWLPPNCTNLYTIHNMRICFYNNLLQVLGN